MPRTQLSQAAQGLPLAPDKTMADGSDDHAPMRAGSMKRFAFLRRSNLAWAERLLLLILIAAFAVKGLVPAWSHLNSDFPNYYLVARLYRAGYPLERVYDWTWLQRQKDHQGIDQGLVSFIPSTLLSALAVAPLSSLQPLEAKHCWLVLNLALLPLIAFLLVRMTKLGWERVALLMFMAFIPLRNNFLFGQMHVVVLFLLTLAAWLFFSDRRLLSGFGLAMAAALKIFPALFLIYFAWKRQWRAAIGLAGGLIAVALISIYLFGMDACLLYVRQVLSAGLRGETLDPYNPAWNSWTALLRRLFIAEPELNPSPVAHLPWLYAFLQPLIHGFIFVAFMWVIGSKKRDADGAKLEWASFVFLLLFLSSQPGSYHFVALILTAVLAGDYLLAHDRTVQAGAAVAIYGLIGSPLIRFPWVVPAGWQNLLFFSRLAWLTMLGALLLWMLVPRSDEWLWARFNSKSAFLAAVVLIVLTAAGFVSTQRHLRGQFENYSTRIATTPGGLLASEPAVSAMGILFTTMTPTGYTIRRQQNEAVMELAEIGEDWFHASAADETDVAWAEQSTRDGSRVVRLALDSAGHATKVAIDEENAQEPIVSRDGQFLAFLRSANGRNSLWVREIGATGGIREPGEAREIAGEDYDVHEATFLPDHRMIFSAKKNGKFAFYVARHSGGVEELRNPICSARYPAISPDGQWIAFSCELGESAEIHVTDLDGNHDKQLTSGDCNSISPAWTTDSKHLVYATDCGRGLGLTALANLTVFR
jgi:hypothetical protein